MPGQDGSPAEGDLVARDRQGVTVKPMAYDVLLTADEHEKVLAKAFAIYEDAALHQSDRNLWKKVIPTREQWKSYRTIIQHWSQTMRAACEIDFACGGFH